MSELSPHFDGHAERNALGEISLILLIVLSFFGFWGAIIAWLV
jgi:hypothetical protein